MKDCLESYKIGSLIFGSLSPERTVDLIEHWETEPDCQSCRETLAQKIELFRKNTKNEIAIIMKKGPVELKEIYRIEKAEMFLEKISKRAQIPYNRPSDDFYLRG